MEADADEVFMPQAGWDKVTEETSNDQLELQKRETDSVPSEEMSLRHRVVVSSPNTNVEQENILESSAEEKEVDRYCWMQELSRIVQQEYRRSSWWERHGVDWSIIGLAMCLLPAGFLCLRSQSPFLFVLGILILGLAHSVITVKGGHMTSHRTMCQSPSLGKLWATFFIEVCSGLPQACGEEGHVKLHHGHTNVIGLGDSSIWKAPALRCGVYMFVAPLALPILTVLVGLKFMMQMPLLQGLRSLCCISLGLWCHFQVLVYVSGLSLCSALGCMFLSRALLTIPFIHVNIFQHIGLAMFSPSNRPPRLQLMTHSVLNLPRNLLLDWTFGHSIVSCHLEHHLFPYLSDNMCLKVKPQVSSFLKERNLPYLEDTYLSRLQLFLRHYEELMVLAPSITDLAELR
ncbi:fatty acid desaturase 6 [Bombina bombina]|uniref:fatty acid desaturase 6 n=1 Tax=Bombina bombina TaxID=8345 RepID=UPI00235A483C|nr:fatty acid desaturase 6 [Bombina bombina]